LRYWWVNQNQTFKHEFEGGYLWSPKVKKDGKTNPYYESMTRVSPGDLVFSFKGMRIPCLGIIKSTAYEAIKPAEFESVGSSWARIGWKVDVEYTELNGKIRPKDHISVLVDKLPLKYSPLRANGNGIQSVYLTEVPEPLASALIGLIGEEAKAIMGLSSEEAAVEAAEGTRARGQGFAITPKVRRAVEEWAMRKARVHFEDQGYAVKVKGKPYDLYCTRGSETLYVEVKGTQGSGGIVFLTRNEVKFAIQNAPHVALYIVHSIVVNMDGENPTASGGLVQIHLPWNIDESELSPIAYEYTVSGGAFI
jgi:hypothetical protein